MAVLVQKIIDTARYTLNDPDKVRFTDVELLAYLNDCLLVFRKKRPDLFFGQWATLPANLTLTDPWPTPDEYTVPVQYYLIARGEAKDDEFEDNNRAAQFMQMFEGGVLSP